MAERLTKQQQMAVDNRGGRLLVSAAAGSGKTKVLVDRLMGYLTEGKGTINIDDFLIITYTKAAAAELRSKIAAKLNEKLSQTPDNKHLQRQLQRLYLTKISTVHSFCAEILREYAYKLDVPADFRVADERECQLMQLQVLEKMLDQAYQNADAHFLDFVDSQQLGRDDRIIPQIILQVYNAARCHIDPDQWLDTCIANSKAEGLTDVSETQWGAYLITDLHNCLDLTIDAFEKCISLAEKDGNMEKPVILLKDTVIQLKQLRSKTKWNDILSCKNIDYGRLNFTKKSTDEVLKDRIKAVRTHCKKMLDNKLKPFADPSERVLLDLGTCESACQGLVFLVREFSKCYDAAKKGRRVLDFGDLEHRTLDLLMGKKRQGITQLAYEISDRFCEIMVDEYQDSNAVQDRIFTALTEKRQNCFMVGDVKQSIYQFRLADPEIFLDKYRCYPPAELAQPGEGRKITLSSNFRSAGAVLNAVNDVFACCMSPQVGGLVYGQEERLHEGIAHTPLHEPEIELTAIEVSQDTYAEEAAYTAKRIKQLLDGNHFVRTSDGFRPITPDDIVILLRSPGSVGGEFQYALEQYGIRVNTGSGFDLLQTQEVGFLYAMLQIIDNPLQDIPLLAVLSSRVMQFSADELAEIRSLGNRRNPFYDSLIRSENQKVKDFLGLLNHLRSEAKLRPLSRLVAQIIDTTKTDTIFGALPDGAVRKSNIQAFYQLAVDCQANGQKELIQFLSFINGMEDKGLTISTEQTSCGAVTIMSIHKSKGLEFPVVFLCGLSRDFNREDVKAQVLCHKQLGIGLNCIDQRNRVRYPSVAKKAIAAKILSDSLSEEMRVLYVAMTRAKDRLIMTYAAGNLQKDLEKIASCMDVCDPLMLTSTADCPGVWVMMTALQRTESSQLFSIAGKPDKCSVSDIPWDVKCLSISLEEDHFDFVARDEKIEMVGVDTAFLKQSLCYRYPNEGATRYPSKRTATQLKGRSKDHEAAENTVPPKHTSVFLRKPTFIAGKKSTAVSFGNCLHSIMQHINLQLCDSPENISSEINRIVDDGFVSAEDAAQIDPQWIWQFFSSDIGLAVRNGKTVLREFKFSILDDASNYGLDCDDKILLQGVVDCAVVQDDGLIIVDFKTDHITEETCEQITEAYKSQVLAYGRALSKIFEKDILSANLYFFRKNQFVSVI